MPLDPGPHDGGRTASKGAQTRRALLDAAIARFGREGYRATSVADIARDASLGGTVAYAYFPNKEALFLAAVDEDAAAVIGEGLSAALGPREGAPAPQVGTKGGTEGGTGVQPAGTGARPAGTSHRRAVGGPTPPGPAHGEWRQALFFALIGALEHHPLARRLLAGLEPEVTERVLEIPALADLRKVCAERLRAEQLDGTARSDVDAVVIANGVVAMMLSLLMSVVQLGEAAIHYSDEVSAVFDAAIAVPPLPPFPPPS